jgi:membrane protease subunit HflK
VIPKARGAASRLLQEAEAYRARVIANAQGDASRFKQVLVEYQKAPAVTRDRMYLDTMQQIFTNTTKLMVDAKGSGNLLYLPLDKLISQSSNETSGKTGSGTLQMQQSSPSPTETAPSLDTRQRDSRTRDGRDSREREAR